MQLVFYYNPNSKDQNGGANFSPEYLFYVSYEKDGRIYTLNQNRDYHEYDIYKEDKYDNIISISAIVGENGSGKTTLLRNVIGDNYESVIDDPTTMETKTQYLFVVKDDRDILYIYHKIEDGSFSNNTSIRRNHVFDGSYRRNNHNTRKDVALNGVLKNTSVMYITNSYYEKWATGFSSSGGKIKNIMMSPMALGNVSDQYFKLLIFHNNDTVHIVDSDYLWKQRLQRFNTYYGIQPILDLKYLKRLKDETNQGKLFYSNTPNGFKVTFNTVDGILADRDSEFLNYKKVDDPWREDLDINSDNSKAIYDERVLWNAKTIEELRRKLPEEDKICRYIYLNLLFELYIETDQKIPINISSIDDAISCIKTMLDNGEYIKNINKDYYQNALKEIDEMVLMSDECNRVKNIYPPSDFAYDRRMVFLWGNKACDDFLDFIDKQFTNHNSFTLKYLRFQQDRMSSGQRCLQNFITWLDILPQMDVVMGNKIQVLHGNILLLIDEIDLYLHPEWQRQIINELCRELYRVLPEKKIQLIFSTHSPLCLSDVPVENSIYLYSDDTGYHIKNRDEVDQTFGREIYMLYRNAFFLQNTMGEYATEYINEVLDDVNSLLPQLLKESQRDKSIIDEERFFSLNSRIKKIGNEVIRNRLEKMLELFVDSLKK